MLTKNQRYTVTIDGMTSEGMGVARIDGRAVFVKNALRGEKCEILILKVGKNGVWAKCLSVIEPAGGRIAPDCEHFGKCGGCDFRHMSYETELAEKLRRVNDAFARIGGLELRAKEILGAENTLCYRNKAQYPVAGDPPQCGFYRARTHDLIPARRCLLQTEMSDDLADTVIRWMRQYGVPSYDEATHTGVVRHIYVRTAFGTGQIMVCVVAAADSLPHSSELVAMLKEVCGELTTVVLAVNKKPGNVILGDTFKNLYGPGYIEDILMGLRFRLSPASFYQINRDQTHRLYAKAIEYAAPEDGDTVLDLYCGIGTITLSMAAKAGQVIGAEIVPSAVENARQNAEANSIENARFILADAGQAAKQLAAEGLRPDVITLDPPRKGLSQDVIDAVSEMSPKRVVYVSCDPATLARDLKLLAEKGYAAVEATAVDMFPRCAHVETVCLLSRKAQ